MRKRKIDNPRYRHHIKIVRRILPEDEFSSESDLSEVIVYDGIGYGYTDTTTNGTLHVDTNKRKASIPMRRDMWGDEFHVFDETVIDKPYPMDGDILLLTNGVIREEWKVRDVEADNDRTIVYGELNRNIGA
jgi:hypothetical protein